MEYNKIILKLISDQQLNNARRFIYKIYFNNDKKLYYYYTGLSYCAEKDYSRALVLFEASANNGLDEYLLHYNIGVALLESNDLEAAEKAFHKAICLNNNLIAAYQNLAHIFMKRSDIHSAYRIIKTCNSLTSNDELINMEKHLLTKLLKIS
jgi:Flp pilus assembly protein TadD